MRATPIIALRAWFLALPESGGYDSFIEMEPKTQRGRRCLVLPEMVRQTLLTHQERQAQQVHEAGQSWPHHDDVFCTKRGTHLTPNYVPTTFKRLLKKAGLPNMRFHDVRHTAATTLLALGVNPQIVQELLGHTEISMTMDIYSHVLPTMQQEAMEKLRQALGRKEGYDGEAERELISSVAVLSLHSPNTKRLKPLEKPVEAPRFSTLVAHAGYAKAPPLCSAKLLSPLQRLIAF